MHSDHPLRQTFRAEPSFWIPEPQQSLVDVVASVYGIYPSDQKAFNSLLYYLHRLNPQVLNVNAPLGRMVLKIIDLHIGGPQALLSENPDEVVKHLQKQFQLQEHVYQRLVANLPHKPKHIEAYRLTLGFLSEVGPTSMTVGGLGMGMMQNTTSAPLQMALKDLLEVHRLKKIGNLSAQQFKMRQDVIIRRIRNALGWTEKYHFGFKTARQALYSNYSHGLKPTQKVMDMLEHIQFLNKVTKGGGLLMTAIGLKMSCNAINAASATQKMEVTYREVGAQAFSALSGAVVGLIVATGPMGWCAGLMITAATSYGASFVGSEFGEFGYRQFGDVFGLQNNRLLKSWCY